MIQRRRKILWMDTIIEDTQEVEIITNQKIIDVDRIIIAT
jgi:hypothetical protein